MLMLRLGRSRRLRIIYGHASLTKSEIYLHVLPLFTARRVDLLDVPRLVDQLCGLKRKVGQGGRESVDHPRGGHDDLANSVCGLLWRLSPTVSKPLVFAAPVVFPNPFAIPDMSNRSRL